MCLAFLFLCTYAPHPPPPPHPHRCICVLQLEGKGQEGVPVRRAATCVIATLARACTGFGVFQALAPQLPALRAALQVLCADSAVAVLLWLCVVALAV